MALIRTASESDIQAITEIYAWHVRHGAATFEIEPPDRAEMEHRRLEILSRGLPYLAAEIDGEIAGYAYAGPYRARPAYRFTVEDSIYIRPDLRGRKIGQLLLDRLIESCVEIRSRQMIAVIGDSGNAASIRLHAKFGFRQVGVLEKVGRKFGRWFDTVIMQRALYLDSGLSELRRIMERSEDRAGLLQQVADFLRQSRNRRWVGLYGVDHRAGEVRNLVFSGPGMPLHPVFRIDQGLTGIAIREKRTINVGDVASERSYLTAFGTTRSEIIVPIFDHARDIVAGTIDVESEDFEAFSDIDQIFLEDCSEIVRSLWAQG